LNEWGKLGLAELSHAFTKFAKKFNPAKTQKYR